MRADIPRRTLFTRADSSNGINGVYYVGIRLAGNIENKWTGCTPCDTSSIDGTCSNPDAPFSQKSQPATLKKQHQVISF